MLDNKKIEQLTSKGFNRWTKGNIDRLYINASQLGLVCSYYNTGNISSAEFNGDRLSNRQGYRYKAAKTFINVKTGEVYSDIPALKEAAEKLAEIDTDDDEEEELHDDWRPGDAPWKAPGMSVSDFI